MRKTWKRMYLAGPGASGLQNDRSAGPEFKTTKNHAIGIEDAVPLTLDLVGDTICETGREEAKQHPS
jgi:hypothetical protein